MSLWVVPAAGVIFAVALATILVAADHRVGQSPWRALPLVEGGPESARTVLSVIAASMVTSISLIFSVTMVVLQLASAQYSPRVLASFIRDRLVQAVLAAYIGTFVYCLLVLPAVQEGQPGEPPFVPGLAVTAALGLALASLGLFVRYVHHVAHAIRAVTIINNVAAETRSAVEDMYPERMGHDATDEVEEPRGAPSVVITWPSPPGVLLAVDEDELLRLAITCDAMIEIRRGIGEFVTTDAPLFDVHGTVDDVEAVRACATVGKERTLHQDPAYGFRQIVDIAERALSPGLNDPTTAVQCIDQLHDLLRRLVDRRYPSALRVDDTATLRVIAPRFGWDDYVHLAFDEIRHYGGRSIQVTRRLSSVVEDLLPVAPPRRRPALQQQRELLRRSLLREFDDTADHAAARIN